MMSLAASSGARGGDHLMYSLLTVAFFVGLASTVTGGLDYLLAAEQRRWLDDKLETLTLQIHYQRPLRWMVGESTDGRGAVIGIVLISGWVLGTIQLISQFSRG